MRGRLNAQGRVTDRERLLIQPTIRKMSKVPTQCIHHIDNTILAYTTFHFQLVYPVVSLDFQNGQYYNSGMGLYRKLSILSAIMTLLSFSAVAETVGMITFLEGAVEIDRDGQSIPDQEIQTGYTVQMFDTLRTGKDGFVEVNMSAPSDETRIKIKPETSFYFEGPSMKSSTQRTIFQLLRGSLEIFVKRLTRSESSVVQTDSAIFAVRGTEFSVDIAVDRSSLVTVSEGLVEIQVNSQTSHANPGDVAFIDTNNAVTFSQVDIEELPVYRKRWRESRLEAMRINLDMAINHHIRLWKNHFPELEKAQRELESHNRIFRYWNAVIDGSMKKPSMSRTIMDKQAVSSGMMKLRSALPLTERLYYTLVDLEKVYDDGNSPDIDRFYRFFEQDGVTIRRMLSRIRYMIRIFQFMDESIGSYFNSGSSPMDSIPVF